MGERMSHGMRAAALAAAVALTGLSTGPAGAATLCPQGWCRKAEALVQRWLGRPANRDPEIIRPRPGIDPQMALAPPRPRGTLRVIRPHTWPEQQ